jgi:hypothetical protein
VRFFYDCEFIEDGQTIDLISIGIVSEDGREYYAVASDAPWDRVKRHPWLMQNVVPSLPGSRISTPIGVPAGEPEQAKAGQEWFWHLDHTASEVKPKWVIANEIRDFLPAKGDGPELWADYGAYDHVVLCQLWGTMMDLPEGIPMWTHDLQQELERLGDPPIPGQESGEHNALADARHLRDAMAALATP